MNYLKRLIGVLSVAAISLSSTNGFALAQDTQKYVDVGSDSNGDPFLLDTTTMGETDKKFGSVIKIYQLKNELMYEYALHAACGDEKLWIVGHRVYNGNTGKKISEGKDSQEIPARGDAPGSTAMKYYCQTIGARGW
ncbi:hypothetical protein NSTC745_06437 [Nostoc sp. DSM 114161]|jgi:hypothetical protein|uniref:hypothetical protein n=1 Tax=Nostoc sp. DSM 114161 TaxID=3440143 RepID=UPI00404630A6